MQSIMYAVICLLVCPLLSGCYHIPEAASVASIAPSTEWHLETRCGYQHCYPLVEFLVSKDLEVRVEPRNIKKSGICTVAVTFITQQNTKYTFVPSGSKLNFQGGKSVFSHDFTCSHTMYTKDTFDSDNYLKKPIELNGYVHKGLRYDCYILYFNTSPPETEETFSLDIKGLERDGTPVVLPQVQFSKEKR